MQYSAREERKSAAAVVVADNRFAQLASNACPSNEIQASMNNIHLEYVLSMYSTLLSASYLQNHNFSYKIWALNLNRQAQFSFKFCCWDHPLIVFQKWCSMSLIHEAEVSYMNLRTSYKKDSLGRFWLWKVTFLLRGSNSCVYKFQTRQATFTLEPWMLVTHIIYISIILIN